MLCSYASFFEAAKVNIYSSMAKHTMKLDVTIFNKQVNYGLSTISYQVVYFTKCHHPKQDHYTKSGK
jgi:hypothetical protein